MENRLLDYFALCMLITVAITFLYAIIYIHDIPFEIAKKRNHPHQDAIHTAGWVSLFLLHTIWPFLWIWATLYNPKIGWGLHSGGKTADDPSTTPEQKEIESLKSRISALEKALKLTEVN
ncbi:DUF3302 domain-containing protein [Desulfomarina sp.]